MKMSLTVWHPLDRMGELKRRKRMLPNLISNGREKEWGLLDNRQQRRVCVWMGMWRMTAPGRISISPTMRRALELRWTERRSHNSRTGRHVDRKHENCFSALISDLFLIQYCSTVPSVPTFP
jgi:hypothetical protein